MKEKIYKSTIYIVKKKIIIYNIIILFKRKFFEGGEAMTNADLVLKLVEMLIESEKKQKAKTNEQNCQSGD